MFLSLEIGLARDSVVPRQNDARRLKQAEQQIEKQREHVARQNQELRQARQQLASEDREPAGLRAALDGSSKTRGVRAENIIWIFGSGRSGSTWLSSMMGDLTGQTLWGEPWVGTLFGNFYYGQDERRRQNPQFILGRHRESWLKSIRNFVLDAASATFPDLEGDDYLVIKEPNGSIGAPLLMEALPESRMVLLVRDPRDVVASVLDGARQGNWLYERNERENWKRKALPDNNPNAFARHRSRIYLLHAGSAKKAYDAHRGRKVLVRYEDLRADTLGTMKRIYASLEIPVNARELARTVEEHSWENIPEKEKGEGKFYRKAAPGGWKEDLTPKQAEIVETITAPLLKEFYPA